MKRLSISILCALFLFSASCAELYAQTQNGDENYYSNPRKGIKPSVPTAYYDTTVVNKSDDITVELAGEVNDTTPKKDTTTLKLKSIAQYERGESPYYWGASLYYSWDPWYSPYWNTWYYPGWGGSHWRISYSWGYGPYWSFGFGYSWAWGSPWWYWDPYFYPGYYGYYGWGGYAYHYNGWRGYSNYGHRYLGSGNRGAATSPTMRGNTPAPRPASVGRGTVRRGGVDLNNGGRASRGNVSGTGSVGRGSAQTGSRTPIANNSGRYAKPSNVASQRNASSAGSRTNGGVRSSSRSSYSSTPRTGRFESGRSTDRSSFNSRSTSTPTQRSSRFESSRSTSSSFNSSRSSSSRSSSFGSGSSSSRSSGGFGGGGSRSSGGGSHSGSSSRR